MKTKKKTSREVRDTLKGLFEDAAASRMTFKTLVNEVTATVHQLPLAEQDIALDILRSLPGLGDKLADIQARNGYDFDNKAGSIYRGHDAFPSIPDSSTAFARSNADTADILQKLDALQQSIQMSADGQAKSLLSKYVEALRRQLDKPDAQRTEEETMMHRVANALKLINSDGSDTEVRRNARRAVTRIDEATKLQAARYLTKMAKNDRR